MDMSVKKATREGYGDALLELVEKNELVYVFDADLSKSTKTDTVLKKHPERFINCGIAEGNMMSVAAGLAATGLIPFASSFAMFAAGRAFEQVRNSIAYPALNVKIGATHAGLSVGEDGATHQCCEDIALMRSIPGMVIINPSDYVQAKAAVFAAAEHNGPVYLRFGRLAVPVINKADSKFEIGKGYVVNEGKDITVIATGLMVWEALKASESLKAMGVSVRVIDMPTIKPLDKELVLKAAKETGRIVTVEEHSIIGGLGEAVASCVCESEKPVPVTKIGVDDKFGVSGKAQSVLERFGLSDANIISVVKKCLKK